MMTESQVIAAIQELPKKSQVNIFRYLCKNSMWNRTGSRNKADLGKIKSSYSAILSRIVGYPVTEQKRGRNTILRYMIMTQLYNDGFRNQDIARVYNVDHSIVYRARLMVSDIITLSNYFPVEINIWKNFQKEIENGNID